MAMREGSVANGGQRRKRSRQGIPAPQDVLGYPVGEERKIPDWPEMVEYFTRLDNPTIKLTYQVSRNNKLELSAKEGVGRIGHLEAIARTIRVVDGGINIGYRLVW